MNDQSGVKIIFVHDSRDVLAGFIFVSKKHFVPSFRLRSVTSAAHHGLLKHVFAGFLVVLGDLSKGRA